MSQSFHKGVIIRGVRTVITALLGALGEMISTCSAIALAVVMWSPVNLNHIELICERERQGGKDLTCVLLFQLPYRRGQPQAFRGGGDQKCRLTQEM